VTAGHKGNSEAVKKSRKGRRNRLKGGGGHLKKKNHPSSA